VQPTDRRGSELITLSSNEKRDAQLRAAQAHIDKYGPIVNKKLRRFGHAYCFADLEHA
jgi:hypothetical protein